MTNYYEHRIKQEDLDWRWATDWKARVHKLTLTHIPTGKSVNGTVADSRIKNTLSTKKHELTVSLTEKLEDLVFGNERK